MSDITNRYGYVKKKVPDPQVLDAANQFLAAAQLLATQPPGSGIVLPELMNCVFALELFLKSLSSYSVIETLEDHGDGVKGGVVTAKPAKWGHEPSKLFDAADAEVREHLESSYATSSLHQENRSLRELLRTYDDAFVSVRYVFEDSAGFKNLNRSELHQLVQMIQASVETLPRKAVLLK